MNEFAPMRKLIIVLTLLFLIETAVMAIINYLQLPDYVEAVFDSLSLILLAIPVLY